MSATTIASTSAPKKIILAHARPRRPEVLIFIILLVVANAQVVFGACWSWLIFQPEAMRDGEWWRLLSHPLIHVTWYHLLLDGSAFLMLYQSLLEERLARRMAYVVAAAAGSLILAWTTTPLGAGLCGLSGIAHGLMAVSALELISRYPIESAQARIGFISFGFVICKAALEAATGRMLFGFLDFGLLGQPVAVSHAGGIIGGLFALLFDRRVEGGKKKGLSLN